MLRISGLLVRVGDFELRDLSLEVADGEYFVILGASGAGKTLLLETIAGRYRLGGGRIELDGQDVSALLPERRNIGFVYQNYELFPHLSVEQNIAFGLKYKGCAKHERRARAQEMLEILSLGHVRQNYPGTLSGGEKQRTAIGRSLVLSPRLLLLDEPMSSLDYMTKQSVKNSIKQVHRQFSPMVLHVTHDIEEALFFADRIGIIKDNTMPYIFGPDDISHMEKGDFYDYL